MASADPSTSSKHIPALIWKSNVGRGIKKTTRITSSPFLVGSSNSSSLVLRNKAVSPEQFSIESERFGKEWWIKSLGTEPIILNSSQFEDRRKLLKCADKIEIPGNLEFEFKCTLDGPCYCGTASSEANESEPKQSGSKKSETKKPDNKRSKPKRSRRKNARPGKSECGKSDNLNDSSYDTFGDDSYDDSYSYDEDDSDYEILKFKPKTEQIRYLRKKLRREKKLADKKYKKLEAKYEKLNADVSSNTPEDMMVVEDTAVGDYCCDLGRTKVNTWMEHMSRDLRCSLCGEIFIKPMVLACYHVFCTFCYEKRSGSSSYRRCPSCDNWMGKTGELTFLDNFITNSLVVFSPATMDFRSRLIEKRESQRNKSSR